MRRRSRPRAEWVQLGLPDPARKPKRRGRWVPGSGRPKKPGAGASHLTRPLHRARNPVHVTLRVRRDVPNLRRHRCFEAIRAALTAGKARAGFRLCHFNVMGNHLHLIVEADDRVRLARGMQGLAIRVARATNRACHRTGKVFADRYHARAVSTPSETRNLLRYVLLNERKHMTEAERRCAPEIDLYSSGAYFDGWREFPRWAERHRTRASPVAPPSTWLLEKGWRLRGLLDANDQLHD